MKEALQRIVELSFWIGGVIYWINGDLQIGLLSMAVGTLLQISRKITPHYQSKLIK